MTKEKKGYEWVQCGDSGGYWKKITGQRHSHKLPLFCPYEKCGRPTSNLDDEYMLNFGCCQLCHTLYIDERKVPLIDVEHYKRRLIERGY